jgi:hypothetical protein
VAITVNEWTAGKTKPIAPKRDGFRGGSEPKRASI